jgi:hypothetical protein
LTPGVPPYRRGGGFGSLGVRFREVVEPHAVSLAPETLGAWLTLALLGVAVAALVAWLVVRHTRRRYRRTAEHELRRLGARWAADPATSAPLEAVPELLKRCALGSFERARVASLNGARWVEFLTSTGPEPFGEAAARALVTIGARGAEAVAKEDAASLFTAARVWIRRHRADI